MRVCILTLERGVAGCLLIIRFDRGSIPASRVGTGSLRAPDLDHILACVSGAGVLGRQHPGPLESGSLWQLDPTSHATPGDGRHDRADLGAVGGLEFGG